MNEATERLLLEREAAKRLAITVSSLRKRRTLGKPPAYVKPGRSVHYKVADLEASIAAGAVTPRRCA